MAKVTDLLKNEAQCTFSFEVTPDLAEEELDGLTVEPTFFSVTWHAKSHQNLDLDIPPLKLAKLLRSRNKNVLLHLSCDLLRKAYLSDLLKMLQEHKICNLFVILGESYNPDTSDFKSSEQLIEAIREQTGDYFCIGVAGLPDCSEEKLLQLQSKIQAGANFILTQAFFETYIYSAFLIKCKNLEIDVPVIPGVFYFESYKQLNGFINMCKIKVSQNILDHVKSEESLEENTGKDVIKKLLRSLFTEHGVLHFNFFTLNKLNYVSSFVKQFQSYFS